ncbi:MAG: hypothetical protein ACI9DO_003434 [Reinekea sp.]|jgi:hypothetical protein
MASKLFRTLIGDLKHPFLKCIHKVVSSIRFHRLPLFTLLPSKTASQTPLYYCYDITYHKVYAKDFFIYRQRPELFRTLISNLKHPFLKFIHKAISSVRFHLLPYFALVTSTPATQTPPLRPSEFTDINARALMLLHFFALITFAL